ncbi:DUF7289 family protein [Haladaptatus caseinilyticus]|uniref:DUF7289 family protein n=1 Tax=Haladaptatus caseinilyticus TaxID=2993314 RepID=UPI00224B11CE|nr:archaellin/type IV pilin N-terminal domain-containing protein [Haladaptatus caseinilyticus]
MVHPSTRAQSETVGVVLLLLITLAGTGAIVAYGSSMLDDSKRVTELDSAEHAMTQLDSKASLVGIGETDMQKVNLGVRNDGRTITRSRDGWMRIEVDPDDGVAVEVMNQTLGSIVYRNERTSIAYQGGGVWRHDGDGSTMVSPPEFHYRKTTLTLPLVTVGGEGALDSRLEVRKNGSVEPKFPLAESEKTNPLSEATVNVTVQSDYYLAWGQFFERRTGGEVQYDDVAKTVTLTLVTPTKAPKIKQGLASTSPQELTIKGSGGNPSFTDSYNSSVGTYSMTSGSNGTIKTVGGVTMRGGAEIRGDLVSGGGQIELKSGNSAVRGNISYGGSEPELHKKASVDGWVANNGSVDTIDPVDKMIDHEIEAVGDENDNDATTAIEGSKLDTSTVTWTLTAGDYHLDSLSLTGSDELVFDLSDGDVDLVVDGDVSVNGGKIRVVAPQNGTANVYMGGTTLSVTNGANVSVSGDRSPAFRIYGPPGTNADFSDAKFTGVLYAPNSDSHRGRISVTTHSSVFGALVGGQTLLQSGGVVHYDQSLVQAQTLPAEYTAIPRVTYMHVSVNRVNVTSV